MSPTVTADSSSADLCQRIQASIKRVVPIENFSCMEEDGKFVLYGEVHSRDEALMCTVVARIVPGVESVVSKIKVIS